MTLRTEPADARGAGSTTGRWSGGWRAAGALAAYLAIAIAYTWPLAITASSKFGGDAGDPSLVAAVLWRNATMLPFTAEWWNAPQFYPSTGVSAFTENFAGIGPLASPIVWLGGSALLAYNVAFFLTWPLSAFTTYLLVRRLTGRGDAAFLAGLAFGFTPYRVAHLSHLHTLSTYWLPLCLLGLHAYLQERRARWLWLFAVMWVLQSLANGHYMLFGGVLVGAWIVYFCSTRDRWRAGAVAMAVWAAASVPLLPVMLNYKAIHEHYGLTRTLNEILAFSARPESFTRVAPGLWLWSRLLLEDHANMFPGITMIALAAAGAALLLLRRHPAHQRLAPRWLRALLGVGLAVSAAGIAISLVAGRWSTHVAGIVIRMGSLDRALVLLLVCGGALAWLTPRTRAAIERRSPFVFYTAMVVVIAAFCFGPVVHAGGEEILTPAPYAWLMLLPGFHELRVPPRFWMLGTLCLSIAAGLAFVHLMPRRTAAALALSAAIAGALMVDGWMTRLRMEAPPERWPVVEPAGRPEPILELPFGEHDYAATFRTVSHRRRIFNGVSGYNPPHYIALADGLARLDPRMLPALATLGPYDVVVDGASSERDALLAYVARAPGAVRIASDGTRTLFRIPAAPQEPALGPAVPIVRAQTSTYPDQAPLVFDGRIETGWGDYPQVPGQWLLLDLGMIREVAGLTHTIGDYLLDFPKQLAVDVSVDGTRWDRVWEGPGAAPTVLAYIRNPREGALRIAFSPHAARYVRLEQLESHKSMWRISEVTVHAPAK